MDNKHSMIVTKVVEKVIKKEVENIKKKKF